MWFAAGFGQKHGQNLRVANAVRKVKPRLAKPQAEVTVRRTNHDRSSGISTNLLAVGILLVGFRLPASRAMPLSYIVAAGLALFIWQVPCVRVAAASVKGLMIAFQLLYIIFEPYCC